MKSQSRYFIYISRMPFSVKNDYIFAEGGSDYTTPAALI